MTPDDPRHGTVNGYSNLKCRCRSCRNAWAEDFAAAKIRRSNRPIPEHVHGSENGYGNYKCRCEKCTQVWNTACRERRKRRSAKANAQ